MVIAAVALNSAMANKRASFLSFAPSASKEKEIGMIPFECNYFIRRWCIICKNIKNSKGSSFTELNIENSFFTFWACSFFTWSKLFQKLNEAWIYLQNCRFLWKALIFYLICNNLTVLFFCFFFKTKFIVHVFWCLFCFTIKITLFY